MMRYWTSLLILLTYPHVCHLYPRGAPITVCDVEGHPPNHGGNKPQNSTCPFQIHINATTYGAGEVIKVTVNSSTNTNETFKGIFLQVHNVPRNTTGERLNTDPIGTFNRLVKNVRIMTCDVSLDTLTHKHAYNKYNTSFLWTAPLLVKNDIIVRATILTNFTTFWINVESPKIKLIRPERLPAEDMEKPWMNEILKMVKSEDNKKANRDLVQARFERGFGGVMDPKGYIMVHYVDEILPFESSYFNNEKTINFNAMQMEKEIERREKEGTTKLSNTTINGQTDKTQTAGNVEQTNAGEMSIKEIIAKKDELIKGLKSRKNSSKWESYYEVLVKALLKGDRSGAVIGTLEDIIAQM